MMMSVVSVFLQIISLVLNPPAGWQIGQEYIGYYSCCMCSKNDKRGEEEVNLDEKERMRNENEKEIKNDDIVTVT